MHPSDHRVASLCALFDKGLAACIHVLHVCACVGWHIPVVVVVLATITTVCHQCSEKEDLCAVSGQGGRLACTSLVHVRQHGFDSRVGICLPMPRQQEVSWMCERGCGVASVGGLDCVTQGCSGPSTCCVPSESEGRLGPNTLALSVYALSCTVDGNSIK